MQITKKERLTLEKEISDLRSMADALSMLLDKKFKAVMDCGTATALDSPDQETGRIVMPEADQERVELDDGKFVMIGDVVSGLRAVIESLDSLRKPNADLPPEPFGTLGKLLVKHGMARLLQGLSDLVGFTAKNINAEDIKAMPHLTVEDVKTESERLRFDLALLSERCARFMGGG